MNMILSFLSSLVALKRKRERERTSSECKIIKAEALDGMILIVTFSNNEERLFDASLLEGEVFYH